MRNLVAFVIAATLATSVGVAFSDIETKVEGSAYPMSDDSTTFTLPNGGIDTTKWYPAQSYIFKNCCVDGQELLWLYMDTGDAMVSGDSIGYIVQYTFDQSAIFSKSKAYITYSSLGSTQRKVITTCDTYGDDPSYAFPYYRVIISDDDATQSTGWPSCRAFISTDYTFDN